MSRNRIAAYGEPTLDWTAAASHAPDANVQATATRAAPGVGRCNVVTGLVVTLIAGATAPAAGTVTFGVLDGASGSGTYLFGPVRLGIPAVAGASSGIVLEHLWLHASEDTPTTIEFSAAAGANTFESVSMIGTVEPA